MNPQIQQKIAKLKRMASDQQSTTKHAVASQTQAPDGLSTAIHSKKDADTFMAELKAISKNAK